MLKLPQPIRFAFVGACNTGLDWLVFFVGLRLWPATEPSLLKASSFSVGVISSFFFNTLWTFREQFVVLTGPNVRLRVFGRFAAVSLLMLALNTLGFALISQLHLGHWAGLIGATLLTFGFGYWLNRTWTYQ